jgi:hypothetical protein
LQQYNQTVSDTDQVCNNQQYFPHQAVERFDWDGGNYQQAVKAATNEPKFQQMVQNVRDSFKVSDSRQYFPLEVVQQFDRGGGNSQQPVQAVTD